MTSFLLLFLNPFKQISKARDAQKEQNLKQIVNALDTYYNDNNSYPTNIGFGSTWAVNGNVYMQSVPQDPDCSGGGSCFSYLIDPSNPQWNVLFAKIANAPNSSVSCPLASLPNCFPANYADSGYNYCVMSGKVDCNYISLQTLPPNAGAGTGLNHGGVSSTPTPTPTTAQAPSPTPTPVFCATYYALTGSGPSGPTCNNLGSDPTSQCTIHGGIFTCYSRSNCTAPLCQ